MELTGHSIIGYGYKRGHEGGEDLYGFDPSTGEKLLPAYQSSSVAGVDKAAELAAKSFAAYRRLRGRERGAFLRRIADNLEAFGEELVERAVRESALPAVRIRNERTRTCFQLRFFAEIAEEGSWVDARIDPGDPARQPLPKPDVRSFRMPLGPVVVLGASNFPLAFSVAGGDTASALAGGNPVVALAHYSHPGTAEFAGMAIRNAAQDLGLPEGVFSLLYDAGHQVASALVAHPEVKAVGFTGSRAGGTALMKIASSRPEPIPFYAEMGSVNPVFILPGVLESRGEALAKGLHASVTLGVGQFCTNPGIVVTTGNSSSFASQLAELMQATAPGTMLNRNIAASYRRAVAERSTRSHVKATAVQESAIENQGNGSRSGTALFETDAATLLEDPTLKSEIFGPSTLLVHSGSREEMLAIAHRMEGNLTATIHGTEEDLREYADLIAVLETKVGRIIFNGFPTGLEVCNGMVHGGPFPATSDGRSTSVGGRAIQRFTRLVCYQDFPDSALPAELQDANPLGIWRQAGGQFTSESLAH
ncbi:MAG TPA: aldehyde dehydrogenase (NADP(+)) [Terriglobia bacterium]|nr:aldehyde dehydrogenase (NADP(+)) [Terriglobia bacterium]